MAGKYHKVMCIRLKIVTTVVTFQISYFQISWAKVPLQVFAEQTPGLAQPGALLMRVAQDVAHTDVEGSAQTFVQRIIETGNHSGWKKTPKSSSPTINLSGSPLNCLQAPHLCVFLNTSRD